MKKRKAFASAVIAAMTIFLLAIAMSSVWTRASHSQAVSLEAEQTLVAERFMDAKKFFEATAMDLTLKAFKEGKDGAYGCGMGPNFIGVINSNKQTFFGTAETKLNEDFAIGKELVETIVKENGVTASIAPVVPAPGGFVAAFELTYDLDNTGLTVKTDHVKKTETPVTLTHYLYVESQTAVPDAFRIQIRDENDQVITDISSSCN
mgnify:CR=1 FL=1